MAVDPQLQDEAETSSLPFHDVTDTDDDKSKTLRARGWLLTLPASDHSEQDVIERLSKYSYIGQLERGKQISDENPEGYLHFQVYIESENPIMFKTLKRKFPRGHFEIRRGSVRQAFEYCSKSDTRVGDTFSNGDMTKFLESSLKLKDYIEMMDLGMSVSDIIDEHPMAIIHIRELEKLEFYRRRRVAIKGPRDIQVHYIWGESGTGKTFSVYEKHGYADVHRVSDYDHPFDSYDSHPVLVLDEFRGQLTLSFMLQLLDPYPVELPARYANKFPAFTTIYVISNIALDEQYPNVALTDPRTIKAFHRRFDSVTQKVGIDHREQKRQQKVS